MESKSVTVRKTIISRRYIIEFIRGIYNLVLYGKCEIALTYDFNEFYNDLRKAEQESQSNER